MKEHQRYLLFVIKMENSYQTSFLFVTETRHLENVVKEMKKFW